MFTSKIYKKSPVSIQNILLSTRALVRKKLRENNKCEQYTQELIAHEYDSELLGKYNDKTLYKTIKQARNTVEYYKSYDLDLKMFPFIDKLEVNSNKDKFLSSKKSGAVIKGATSGTTGAPLVIPQGDAPYQNDSSNNEPLQR